MPGLGAPDSLRKSTSGGPGRNGQGLCGLTGGRGARQMLIPPVANRAIAAAAMIVVVSQPRILAALPFT
jgi:hypothetical protein